MQDWGGHGVMRETGWPTADHWKSIFVDYQIDRFSLNSNQRRHERPSERRVRRLRPVGRNKSGAEWKSSARAVRPAGRCSVGHDTLPDRGRPGTARLGPGTCRRAAGPATWARLIARKSPGRQTSTATWRLFPRPRMRRWRLIQRRIVIVVVVAAKLCRRQGWTFSAAVARIWNSLSDNVVLVESVLPPAADNVLLPAILTSLVDLEICSFCYFILGHSIKTQIRSRIRRYPVKQAWSLETSR